MSQPLVLRDTYGIVLRANGNVERLEKKPSFKEVQKIVGGYVQIVPGQWEKLSWQVCVDEEGLLKDYELNFKATLATGHPKIVGDAVLLRGKFRIT